MADGPMTIVQLFQRLLALLVYSFSFHLIDCSGLLGQEAL